MNFILFVRTGDPDDFLTASTPDLYPKTTGFDFFFPSGSGIFFSSSYYGSKGQKIRVQTVVKFDKIIYSLLTS